MYLSIICTKKLRPSIISEFVGLLFLLLTTFGRVGALGGVPGLRVMPGFFGLVRRLPVVECRP